MKKITLAFLSILLTSFGVAQTYSTGMMELFNEDNILYTAKVDITSDLVTLTLSGPDNRYLGFGFGIQSMMTNGDVVMFYDDSNTPEIDFQLSDRTFTNSNSEPSIDANQDWTITSNTLDSGQRMVVATRALDTGHDDDYAFSTSDASLNFTWAIGHSYALGYHAYKGASMQAFTLNLDDVALTDFKMKPNPARSKFELSLPNDFNNVKLDIFDVLGKKILTKSLNKLSTTINVSEWNSGVYLVRVTSDSGIQTKRFVRL